MFATGVSAPGYRAISAAEGMRNSFRQENAGERGVARLDFGGCAVGQHVAAVETGAGTEVDDAVGAFHDDVVVLDDEQRVALVAQLEECVDQAVVVARVKADGRFVEHVEHAGKV